VFFILTDVINHLHFRRRTEGVLPFLQSTVGMYHIRILALFFNILPHIHRQTCIYIYIYIYLLMNNCVSEFIKYDPHVVAALTVRYTLKV
jgi:hypothetical protein